MNPTNDYYNDMDTGIIKDGKFRKIASNIKPDLKKRVVLSKAPIAEGVTYHVYSNEMGQIILDPQVSIPASELWLYKNEQARETVVKGLKEASTGKISKVILDTL